MKQPRKTTENNEPSFWQNFQSRTDLKKFGDNKLLLYAFDIKYEIEDIDIFASENLIDNSNDKKCDLIYIDNESRTAVVTQSYLAKTIKKEAPANKAADLNTAAGWLLSSEVDEIPQTIRDAATALRAAIRGNFIDSIEFWYLHNCRESKNVKRELTIVSRLTSNALHVNYKENPSISVKAMEVGVETIENWYRSSKATILVTDSFTIEIPGGYLIKGNDWDAFSTAIPLKTLYDISSVHKKDLFSANIRDYLGSIKSDANINNGIKKSAEDSADMFWVYNNGITAIVNEFYPIYNEETSKYSQLRIEGLSIVNGAQTTGAVGSLDSTPNIIGHVPARFIKSNNQAVVNNIIRFNNSQNKIAPSDFRSTDQYQEKLRRDFENYPHNLVYTGGRRGGNESKIKRPQNLIPFEKVTQALASFHQYPNMAYNKTAELWESDTYYGKIFNEETTAEHIIFVFALLKNISDYKLKLIGKQKANKRLAEDEESNLLFLRKRGSPYILIAGISASLEIITSKPVPNKFFYKFLKKPNLEKATNIWAPIVESTISFHAAFDNSLLKVLQDKEQIEKDISSFKSNITFVKRAYAGSVFSDFTSQLSFVK